MNPQFQQQTPTTNTSTLNNNAVAPCSDAQPVLQTSQCNATGEALSAAPAASMPVQQYESSVIMGELQQWCIADPADKRPRNIHKREIGVHDLDQLTDYQTAWYWAEQYGWAVGFILTDNDPFTCIDLDIKEGLDPDEVTQRQERFSNIIQTFASYTEYSLSGKGYHIWVLGNIGAGRKRDGVEIYSRERFIICTGNPLEGYNLQIIDGQAILDKMIIQMPVTNADFNLDEDGDEPLSDQEVLDQLDAAANADKFNALWYGKWQELGYPSASEAELSLMSMFAFYTKNNEQCRRLFRLSWFGERDKHRNTDVHINRCLKVIRKRQTEEEQREQITAQMAQGMVTNFQQSKNEIAGFFAEPARKKKISLLSPQQIISRPSIQWRIKGVLPADGLCAIYGPPGSGKSFVALDMLGAISTGREWFGYKVTAAPVVYVALEGKGGLPQRVKAYLANYPDMNMRFVDVSLDLRKIDDRKELIDVIKNQGLANGVLCIDTLAASAPGMDENTSTDMGMLIGYLHEIQQELGGCVLVVHHTGKDQTRGLRGWSGLTGALDGAIEVTRKDNCREWKITKAKDGEDGKAHEFDLNIEKLGFDNDGEKITSCIVLPRVKCGFIDQDYTDLILDLIKYHYQNADYISPANNSPYSTYKVLSNNQRFPKNLLKKDLTTILEGAEKNGRLVQEEYADSNRNSKKRWRVVD